jgi:hypothetical protein
MQRLVQSRPEARQIGSDRFDVSDLDVPEPNIGQLGRIERSRFVSYTSDLVERGKQVAQEAVGAAADTATESGREQGEELSSTLKERAQDQSPTTAA